MGAMHMKNCGVSISKILGGTVKVQKWNEKREENCGWGWESGESGGYGRV